MGVKIKDLIEKLQEHENQETEVEYLICTANGELVTVYVEAQAAAMKKTMDIFAG